MRTLGGLAIALLAVTGLAAQNRGAAAQNRGAFVNTAPMSRALGSAVPGTGVAAPRALSTNPFPAGSALSPITVPLGSVSPPRNNGFGRVLRNRSGSTVIAYPLYVGGYGGYGYPYYDSSYYTDPTTLIPQQQQPNVTVIMPPQQPPVVINLGSGGSQQQEPMSFYPPQPDAQQQPAPAQATQPATSEPPVYLIAFKDHTIYSAIAYWVDGDTLHYFTSGNTHNQVSISLIDRPLTERLNREMGVDCKLPPAK
jgi:hypothetical protein